MNNIYNEQQQKKLTRAIAMRALMYASGENCYCPVKKPTKFIVTLKPVIKTPNADPYLNLEAEAEASGCTCNMRNPRKTTTAEQIQVRTNNEALKGKTLLNAFRVLTNSKFITIDPKYDYGDKGLLSPSGQQIRLCGGTYETRKNNENCECPKETAQMTKTEKNQNKFLQPGQEQIRQEKRAKSPKSKPSQISFVCENGRIYRILQHGCHEAGDKAKRSPKYRVVYPGGEKLEETKKLPKKERQKKSEKVKTPDRSRESSKERTQLKHELERAPVQETVTPPPMTPPRRCAEKSVGTSDAPSATAQQQTVLDMISWNPLKYFDINCAGASKAKQPEVEPCKEKSPCPLSIFPFPSIRKTEKPVETPAAEAEPIYAVKEEPLPCHEKEMERQTEPPPAPPKAPDISKEIIAQQCNRIYNLELQVNELRRELGHMKTEIIPPDEMMRCTALAAKLRELSTLLADLKTQHTEAIAAVLLAQKQAVTPKKLECTAVTQTPRPPTPPPQRPCPEMKAETVQTYNHAENKLSQTNATFGWRPFIDEATQSSPPSTVPVTSKNTSSVPVSSHASSAASTGLPCRHGTGELPLKESPSFCPYCQCSEYPRCTYIERNLYGEIIRILQQHAPCEVLLSVLLQPNNIYHVNISLTSSGVPLGCIYATERAINEAVEANVFNRFLTFFIVDARISVQQKAKILAHTFEFFKN